MLFKPEAKEDAKTAGRRVARGIGRRMVSLTVMLLILGGLGYLGWNAFQQKPAGRGGPGARPDLPVPVLAAVPRTQDVPVYLDAVGSVRAPAAVIRTVVRGPPHARIKTVGTSESDLMGVIYSAAWQHPI